MIWVPAMLSVWIVSKQKQRMANMMLSFMSEVRPLGKWFYNRPITFCGLSLDNADHVIQMIFDFREV